MKNGKTIVTLMLVIVCCMIAACGKEEKTPENSDSYVTSFYSPDEAIQSISVREGKLYYSTSEGEVYQFEPGEDAKPEKLNLKNSDVTGFDWATLQPDGKGKQYLFYAIGEKTYLAGYDENGELLFCNDISEYIAITEVSDTAVDGEGHLFAIVGFGQVAVFDTDGSYRMTVEATGGELIDGIADDGSGTVYVSCQTLGGGTDSAIRELSFTDGLQEKAYDNFVAGTEFVAFGQTGFLTQGINSLYYYDRENRTQEQLFAWMNLGIDAAQVQQFGMLEDGRIAVFLKDNTDDAVGEIAVLQKVSASEETQKEVLTVGTFSASTNLEYAVSRFNRQSEDYRVEVREYYDELMAGEDDISDAYTALDLDIVSGDCPDILNLRYEDLKKYASKGLLENLAPYVKNSEMNFPANVTEAYTFGENLVALPNTVQVHTLVGSTSELEGMTGWNLEEMMKFAERHPDETVFDMSAQQMLSLCLTFEISQFVDWENHTCHFTDDAFYRILAFCSQFHGDSGAGSSIWNIEDHDALVYEVDINQAEDVNLLQQLLKTKEITFIGFPNENGASGNLLDATEDSYSIASKSQNKDAAWAFLQELYENVPAKSFRTTLGNGFPAEKQSLETFFAYATETDAYDEFGNRRFPFSVTMSREGQNYCFYVPLPEEIEQLTDLLESAGTERNSDEQILKIIEEEAAVCFDGQKTPEQTAELIESRVANYLAEQE